MTNPLATFLSATGVAQPATGVPVAVSPLNPLPITIISGAAGGSIVVDTGAGVDNQSNTLAYLNNTAADPNLLLGTAGFKFDPVTGLWYRDQGAPQANPAQYRQFNSNAIAAGANATLGAPGAGLRIYVTAVQWFATGANTGFSINTGGTVLFQLPNTIPAYTSVTFGTPLRGDVNTALNFQAGGTGTANIQAFIAP